MNIDVNEPALTWPAFLRLADEVDITIVDSWDEWVRDHDLSGYDEPGVMVASDGEIFDLVFERDPQQPRWLGPKGFQRPVSRGQRMGPQELIAFVRPQVEALGPQALAELELLLNLHEARARALGPAVVDFLRKRL